MEAGEGTVGIHDKVLQRSLPGDQLDDLRHRRLVVDGLALLQAVGDGHVIGIERETSSLELDHAVGAPRPVVRPDLEDVATLSQRQHRYLFAARFPHVPAVKEEPVRRRRH